MQFHHRSFLKTDKRQTVMDLTIPGHLSRTNRIQAFTECVFFACVCKKRVCLFFCFLIAGLFSEAQSVSPSTINVTGQSATFDNYQFEWSVGESASIITSSNSNLVITSGVLQSTATAQAAPNTANTFLPGEIKIYPNPTRDIVEINILHRIAGKNKLELFDSRGRKVMEKQFEYNGTGMVEKWDLSKLAAGQYFLSIQLFDPANGGTGKKGAFKIIKIQ